MSRSQIVLPVRSVEAPGDTRSLRVLEKGFGGRKGNCPGQFGGLKQERAAVERAAEVFEDG
jgi:hypothetical protein